MNPPIPFSELQARATPGPFEVSADTHNAEPDQYPKWMRESIRTKEQPPTYLLRMEDSPEPNAELICRLLNWADAGGPAALHKALTWAETYARHYGINLTESNGPLAEDIRAIKASLATLNGQIP